MGRNLRRLPNHPFRGRNRQGGSAAFEPRRHPLQQIKDRDAALLSSRWRISRNRGTKRPRGIQRDIYGECPNACYQNSALQALLLLPKFLNWIAGHNNNGENICIPGNVQLTIGQVTPIGCIPCSLKDLADFYWSERNQNDNGTPQRIPDSHPALQPIRNIGVQYWGESQGDPYEFLGFLLDCCDQQTQGVKTYTGPPPQPQMSTWHSQLAALFMMCSIDRFVCTRCNNLYLYSCLPDEQLYLTRDASTNPDTDDWNPNPAFGPDKYGLNQVTVWPPWEGADTLQRAIAETFEDENGLLRTCQTCHPAANGQELHNKTVRLVGAPEILFVRVSNNLLLDRNGRQYGKTYRPEGVKNDNRCDIPMELNLSKYQHEDTNVPLRYRLSSVISHSGPPTGGHYIATVKGPGGVFIMNDQLVLRVRERQDYYLRRYPQEFQLNAGAAPGAPTRKQIQKKNKDKGKAAVKEYAGEDWGRFQGSLMAYIRVRGGEHE